MFHRQGQFADRQWPIEYFHRAIGTAGQPGAEPQVRFQGQVGMIDQQQGRAVELTIVVIDPCAKLAAQPGQEEHPLHLRAELALPALFQLVEQR